MKTIKLMILAVSLFGCSLVNAQCFSMTVEPTQSPDGFKCFNISVTLEAGMAPGQGVDIFDGENYQYCDSSCSFTWCYDMTTKPANSTVNIYCEAESGAKGSCRQLDGCIVIVGHVNGHP